MLAITFLKVFKVRSFDILFKNYFSFNYSMDVVVACIISTVIWTAFCWLNIRNSFFPHQLEQFRDRPPHPHPTRKMEKRIRAQMNFLKAPESEKYKKGIIVECFCYLLNIILNCNINTIIIYFMCCKWRRNNMKTALEWKSINSYRVSERDGKWGALCVYFIAIYLWTAVAVGLEAKKKLLKWG